MPNVPLISFNNRNPLLLSEKSGTKTVRASEEVVLGLRVSKEVYD